VGGNINPRVPSEGNVEKQTIRFHMLLMNNKNVIELHFKRC